MLLHVARASVEHGLREGEPLAVDPAAYEAELRDPRATFVTLHVGGELHGCTGTLSPVRALVVDVAENAFAAAFRDPRFPALRWSELPDLDVHISLLGPHEPLCFASERELLEQLRPGLDGVVLEEGAHRGTFLPAVWETLPEPREFLAQLKRKAGLAPHHWSERVRVWRYTVESIH